MLVKSFLDESGPGSRSKNMKIVLTYGTYDLLHYGHIKLLARARGLGDKLYVGLSSDTFNALKNKTAFMSYQEREELLLALRFVDKVFPENTWEQKADDIVKYKADLLVMGDDWAGKFDHFSHLCKVAYLERTPLISSTMLRDKLGSYTAG
jgi:glycerol-3-phosphate cytidylyltransferase